MERNVSRDERRSNRMPISVTRWLYFFYSLAVYIKENLPSGINIAKVGKKFAIYQPKKPKMSQRLL